jgi:hypothetical protein
MPNNTIRGKMRNRNFSYFLFIAISLPNFLNNGCTTVGALKGEEGIDISSIKPGMSKEEAERILGPPVRKWVTSDNINYCAYVYDAGIPPDAVNATAYFISTILTWGLFDLYEATGLAKETQEFNEKSRTYRQMAIAYDANNIIINMFDNFSDFKELPSDGRTLK